MTNKHFRESLPLVIFILLFAGCAPKILIQKDRFSNTLGLCVSFSPAIDSATINFFNIMVEDAIQNFNSASHSFKVVQCPQDKASSLFIDVLANQYVGPEQQTFAMILSGVGIALPFVLIANQAPYIFAYVYLPQNRTHVAISLSNDINAIPSQTINQSVSSSPYFGDYGRQRLRQGGEFKTFLKRTLTEIEENLNQ